MNLRNKVSFLLFSFVAVPLFAQTPQQELERLQQNYIQSFISNDDRTASLVELLSGIQPETEISDQVVVELHQRYPFNVEKITGYMETIREDGSWPDIITGRSMSVISGPPLEQKFHKCLSGVFQQLPADRDIASVIKAKACSVKINGMLQIDHNAPVTPIET